MNTMKFSTRHQYRKPLKLWQFILPGLLACVIWAQFLGISHRYTHPFSTLNTYGEPSNSTRAVATELSLASLLWDQRSQSDEANLHSCLLFDAACAGDQILTLISLLVPASEVQHQVQPPSPRIWHADTELAFHSRAPPASV